MMGELPPTMKHAVVLVHLPPAVLAGAGLRGPQEDARVGHGAEENGAVISGTGGR